MKILFFLIAAVSLFGEAHLLLYFDINKTLIATDLGGKKSVDAVLNEAFAEKVFARWDERLQEAISFDSYVRNVLVPGHRDDLLLREKRSEHLQHFIDYLQVFHPHLYEEVYPDYQSALFVLSHSKVFLSFYRLIEELDRKEISYSIVLRSFGMELDLVRREIEAVCKKPFANQGHFRGKVFHFNDQVTEDFFHMYTLMRHSGHLAIQDDWNHWAANGLIGRYGKPFLIDLEDLETVPIFFDDNIRFNDPATLINIIAPISARTGQLIPIDSLIESGQMHRVDTLRAILEIDYFLQAVKKVCPSLLQ